MMYHVTIRPTPSASGEQPSDAINFKQKTLWTQLISGEKNPPDSINLAIF